MFGFRYYMLARSWRGIEWEKFWLMVILLICYAAWVCSDTEIDRKIYFYPEAVAQAPTQAIDDFMKRYEADGFAVYHHKDLESDSQHRNRLIILYEIVSADSEEHLSFKWVWEVPFELTYHWESIEDRMEEATINGLLTQCELIPLTSPSREVHDELVEFIGNRKIVWVR